MTLERISESENDEQFRKAVKDAIDSAKKEIIVITGELGSYAFPELQQSVQNALARGIIAKFYANESAPIKFVEDISKRGGDVFIDKFRARDHYLVIDQNKFIVSQKEGIEIPTKIGTRRSIRSMDQPEDAKKIVRFFDNLVKMKKKGAIMNVINIIYRFLKTPKEPNINEIITALENPRYDWRTIDGIVKETKIPRDKVIQVIDILDEVVRSTDKKGNYLYTTRDHYQKTHSIISRFLTIASGRIRV